MHTVTHLRLLGVDHYQCPACGWYATYSAGYWQVHERGDPEARHVSQSATKRGTVADCDLPPHIERQIMTIINRSWRD